MYVRCCDGDGVMEGRIKKDIYRKEGEDSCFVTKRAEGGRKGGRDGQVSILSID